jgi:hypothetical protein
VRKPPHVPPSQNDGHTMIGDFTVITVYNSDNDLHLPRVTIGRMDFWMLDIAELAIWRTVSLWMFLLSLLFGLLLYFFGSLAQYNWSRHGFLPPQEIHQVVVDFPSAADLLNGYHSVLMGWGWYGFISLRTLNGCLIVSFPFLLLYGFIQPRRPAPKDGDNLMAPLHLTCPRPGNTRFI